MQGFVMMQTYKYSRNSWENQEKAIFDGVGMYDIPVIEPEEYHHVEWIGFNSARTTQKRKGKGIHFFLDDYQFTRIWKYPNQYVEMLKQFDFVMSPDFSTYTDFPNVLNIYNHFRKHWVAAYLQAHGVHVIPTISWSTPDSFDWCFDGEPRESTVAVSSVGCADVLDDFIAGYYKMVERLNPSTIIFYGKVPEQCKGNIVHVKSFTDKWKEAKTNGW